MPHPHSLPQKLNWNLRPTVRVAPIVGTNSALTCQAVNGDIGAYHDRLYVAMAKKFLDSEISWNHPRDVLLKDGSFGSWQSVSRIDLMTM